MDGIIFLKSIIIIIIIIILFIIVNIIIIDNLSQILYFAHLNDGRFGKNSGSNSGPLKR